MTVIGFLYPVHCDKSTWFATTPTRLYNFHKPASYIYLQIAELKLDKPFCGHCNNLLPLPYVRFHLLIFPFLILTSPNLIISPLHISPNLILMLFDTCLHSYNRSNTSLKPVLELFFKVILIGHYFFSNCSSSFSLINFFILSAFADTDARRTLLVLLLLTTSWISITWDNTSQLRNNSTLSSSSEVNHFQLHLSFAESTITILGLYSLSGNVLYIDYHY